MKKRSLRVVFSAISFGIAFASVFGVVLDARCAPTTGAKIDVAGVRVIGEGYGDSMNALRPFNWSKGTSIAIMVTVPDGGIIEFDRDKSKLDKFVDDVGTDLLKSSESFQSPGFDMMTSVSADGKACMPEINTPNVPSKGAKNITATGTLVLKQATKKQSFKHDNAPIQFGTKLNAGSIPIEITKVGKPAWGDGALEITLQANEDMSSIASIRFLDAQGNEIKTQSGGTSSSKFMDKVVIEKSFILSDKVDKATVEVTYWTDMKNITLPFSIGATVGLS